MSKKVLDSWYGLTALISSLTLTVRCSSFFGDMLWALIRNVSKRQSDCAFQSTQNSYMYMFKLMNIHWPKMKTLHFISLNNYFVSIHVVVRFTHAYRDFVGDNDYAIFILIPGLLKCQRLKNLFRTLHVLRNRWFINSFKTDKKTFTPES